MRFGKRAMPGVMRFGKKSVDDFEDYEPFYEADKRAMPGVMRFGKRPSGLNSLNPYPTYIRQRFIVLQFCVRQFFHISPCPRPFSLFKPLHVLLRRPLLNHTFTLLCDFRCTYSNVFTVHVQDIPIWKTRLKKKD